MKGSTEFCCVDEEMFVDVLPPEHEDGMTTLTISISITRTFLLDGRLAGEGDADQGRYLPQKMEFSVL